MNFRTLDLNLLRAFNSIYMERNVSAAARKENLSQPAMSNALTRLRRTFGDELFIKTPAGMEPTALATQLIKPVSEALNILKQGLEEQPQFDPTRDEHMFRVLMSDAGESSILPPLMANLSADRSKIALEVVRLPHERYAEALQTGAADLAIGNLPFLRSGFENAHLFSDPYCVIVREGHPLQKHALTLESFVAANHIAIATGKADALVDKELSRRRIRRHVMLKVSHYHVAVDVVAGSDCIATVPNIIAKGAKGVAVLSLPLTVTPADVMMVWHALVSRDAANIWLRQRLIQLNLSGLSTDSRQTK